MTTNEFKRYKEALSKKTAELSETLGNRKPIAIEVTPEACERIVQAAQRELAVVTLDRHSRLLSEVKAAIARIEDGSYGVCERCEEAITPRRLDAIPWARYCVQCQDIIDRGPNPATGAILERHIGDSQLLLTKNHSPRKLFGEPWGEEGRAIDPISHLAAQAVDTAASR